MNTIESEPRFDTFNNSSRRVELSEEDIIIGAGTYGLFIEKLKRPPAWTIDKRGIVTNLRTGEKIDGLENERISPELARVIDGFKMVEDFLPDYMGEGNKLVRNNMGLFMINIQWGSEELNHGLALGNILEQTGHRTRKQTIENYQRNNLERIFELPYATARQIVAYGALQERSTCLGYLALEKRAEMESAPKTAKILALIAADEAYHCAGYIAVMQIYHETDPEGTIIDSLDIARNFRMPAENLHPKPGQWIKDLIRIGALSKELVAERVVHDTLLAFRFISKQEASETADGFFKKQKSQASNRARREIGFRVTTV